MFRPNTAQNRARLTIQLLNLLNTFPQLNFLKEILTHTGFTYNNSNQSHRYPQKALSLCRRKPYRSSIDTFHIRS